MIDDGQAIHYTAIARGTPVYSVDEVEVGTVAEVLDNFRERILDGFVIKMSSGDLRFVDAPEVKRTAERGVTLTIDADAVAQLPPPEKGSAGLNPARAAKGFGRLFGKRAR